MDYFEQIDDYKNNLLTESEKLAFEAEMEKDAKLKQAVADHDVAMDVIGSILEGEVRKVIGEEGIINNEKLIINNGDDGDLMKNKDDAEEEGREVGVKGEKGEKIESGKVRRMNWMRWAAAAVVVFVLGWWGVNQMGVKLNLEDEIFANHITYLPSLGSKSNSDLLQSKIDSAVYFYDKRAFGESLPLFEELAAEKSNDTINIYLAHLYFINKNYAKSRLIISKIPNKTQIESGKKELEYYLYLIEDDSENAKSILNTMTQSEQDRLDDLLNF